MRNKNKPRIDDDKVQNIIHKYTFLHTYTRMGKNAERIKEEKKKMMKIHA